MTRDRGLLLQMLLQVISARGLALRAHRCPRRRLRRCPHRCPHRRPRRCPRNRQRRCCLAECTVAECAPLRWCAPASAPLCLADRRSARGGHILGGSVLAAASGAALAFVVAQLDCLAAEHAAELRAVAVW